MRKSRFSEEQMVRILRETDKTPMAEVAKQHGGPSRRCLPGASGLALEPANVKRLCQVEQKNARLRKLVAERVLELEIMKEVAPKNSEHHG